MKAPDSITRAEALALADEGLERAEQTSGEAWLEYARGFFKEMCKRHRRIDNDTPWQDGLELPANKKAIGGVWRHARESGWIEEWQCEGYPVCTTAVTPPTHGRLIRIYNSRIYEPQPRQEELPL